MLGYNPKIGWILNSGPLMLRHEEVLKALGGRRVKEGLWKFPGLCMYAYRLLEAFPQLCLFPAVQEKLAYPWGFPLSHPDDTPSIHSLSKWDELYTHQKKAVNYLISSTLHGSLVNLWPGMGKSAVAIMAAKYLEYDRVLIVSPLTTLLTWEEQCKEWGGITPTIVRWTTPGKGKNLVPQDGWVLTNYDTAVRNPVIQNKKWELVILDESVLVKNRKTIRFKELSKVCRGASKVWLLSGAPITRSIDDLYTQFKLLEYSAFPSFWRFAEFYCEVEETVWGRNILGSKQGIDFHQEFKDLMFSTSQSDLPELPDIIFQSLDLELGPTQLKLYEEIEGNLIKELSIQGLSIPNRIAQIVRLQQVVSDVSNILPANRGSSCKVNAVLEMLWAKAWEMPVVIWVNWRGTGYNLWKSLQDSGFKVDYIHGGTPEEDRKAHLKDYQNGDLDILILSLEVGKYGLNSLMSSRTAVYVDRTFSMDAYFQSLHRFRRIGTQKPPLVVTLRCPGTIDELVEDNLRSKSIDLSKITDESLLTLMQGLASSRTSQVLLSNR